MKYIRTKDGRIMDTKGKELINPRVAQFYSNKELANGMWVEGIINQADTIEELCDEFVIEYPSGEFDTLNHDYSARLKYMGMEQYNAKINHGWCKLYGAIWTDKGLIYVAKMNEKGVLELL